MCVGVTVTRRGGVENAVCVKKRYQSNSWVREPLRRTVSGRPRKKRLRFCVGQDGCGLASLTIEFQVLLDDGCFLCVYQKCPDLPRKISRGEVPCPRDRRFPSSRLSDVMKGNRCRDALASSKCCVLRIADLSYFQDDYCRIFCESLCTSTLPLSMMLVI